MREGVKESGVDGAVAGGGSTVQTFEVFKRAAMRLGAGGGQGLGAGIRAREAEDLMTRAD